MKHKRSISSIAMASILLVSLCAVYASTSVSAAPSSNTDVQSGLVGAPAGVVGAPAVVSRDTTSFDLFVRGTDNALWWRHIPAGGTWGAWKPLYGGLSSSPAVAAYGTNYLQVYVRGTNSYLYTRWSNDGGSSWTGWYRPIEGQLLAGTGPAACFAGNEQFLFVTGTNNAVYWSHWTLGAGAKPFTRFPQSGFLSSSPSATATATNEVFVVGRGTNGGLYRTYTQNHWATWAPWVNKGGPILAGSSPAACLLNAPPNLYYVSLFYVGTDHKVYFKKFPDSPQVSLGAPVGGTLNSVAVDSRDTNSLDVFAGATNNKLYFDWTSNGGNTWSNWLTAPA